VTWAGLVVVETASGLGTGAAVVATAGVAAALAVLHLLAPRVHTLPGVPRRAIGSFAGGLAVAYVFLHLLPEVAAGNEAVGELLEDVVAITPLLELSIFAVALAGFALLYGMERLAVQSGSPRGGPSAEGREPPHGVYLLHVGSFGVYNALITYTMPLRFRTGVLFALLFTVAMGLHFVLTDRTLAEHYPRRFRATGRYVLAGALVAGWVLAALFAPTSTVVVSLLTALLAGGILLNVFKEELPTGSDRSSFPWFLGGLLLYAALLTAVTVLEA
jgi:hypothetical protein